METGLTIKKMDKELTTTQRVKIFTKEIGWIISNMVMAFISIITVMFILGIILKDRNKEVVNLHGELDKFMKEIGRRT